MLPKDRKKSWRLLKKFEGSSKVSGKFDKFVCFASKILFYLQILIFISFLVIFLPFDSLDPLRNVLVLQALELDVGLVRPIVRLVVVHRRLGDVVSVEDQSRVAFVAFVADAEPVRFLEDLPLAAVDEVGVENQRRASLAPHERPDEVPVRRGEGVLGFAKAQQL